MPSDPKPFVGDNAAAQQRFLSLFLRSEREVFRSVAALVPNVAEAEDIVQQTALTLWEKFDTYDPARPFTPWACWFALNKARQWIERRQRWQAFLAEGLAEELANRREALRPDSLCQRRGGQPSHLESGVSPSDSRLQFGELEPRRRAENASLLYPEFQRRDGRVRAVRPGLERLRNPRALLARQASTGTGVVGLSPLTKMTHPPNLFTNSLKPTRRFLPLLVK